MKLDLVVGCAHCGQQLQLPMELGTALVVQSSTDDWPSDVTFVLKAGSHATVLHKACVSAWHGRQQDEAVFTDLFT